MPVNSPGRNRRCRATASERGLLQAKEMIMGNVRSLQEDQIRTWNDHDEASWVNLFSPEATFSGPGGVRGSGTEMAKTF